jgi:hypothetical protein
MEKELSNDYKKIIKFINELHYDLKHKKVNTKKLNKLKKEVNLQKLNVLKKQIKNQKGGAGSNSKNFTTENLNDLVKYGNIIDQFSKKLVGTTTNLGALLKSFPILLNQKSIEELMKNLAFDPELMKSSMNKQKVFTQSNSNSKKIQGGGASSNFNKMNQNIIADLGLNYIQSLVYMSQVVQYISLWINNVNSIIMKNQLGMSDKCLENTKLLMQSLGDLTKSYPQVPSPTQVIGTR